MNPKGACFRNVENAFPRIANQFLRCHWRSHSPNVLVNPLVFVSRKYDVVVYEENNEITIIEVSLPIATDFGVLINVDSQSKHSKNIRQCLNTGQTSMFSVIISIYQTFYSASVSILCFYTTLFKTSN